MTRHLLFPAREPSWTGGFDQLVRWGVSPATGEAFWLRQQTSGRRLTSGQTMEATLATFRRNGLETALVHEGESLSSAQRKNWRARGDWQHLQYNWAAGSFVGSTATQVHGRLFTPHGSGHCALTAAAGDVDSRLDWPLNGLVAQPDRHWQGEAAAAGLPVHGSFRGGQWQHWGRLASPGLALANGVHFEGRPEVSFLGIGQTLAPQWQAREPLALGVGLLRIGDRTLSFDRWWPAATVDAPRLDNYRWMATLVNAEYRLQLITDGGNPRIAPWLALNEQLPSGDRRVLKMTPFATLRLRLFARGRHEPIEDLRSDCCLLMTAIPGNQVTSRGPLSEP